MKLNIRKTGILILLITMVLTLSACGDSKGKGEETNGSKEGTSQNEVLNVWLPATAIDGNDEEIWSELVKPFEKENNAKVEFQFISWKDYEAKFASGVSTGTGPDVARMYVEMFPTFIDSGAVEDLSTYLTEDDRKNYTVLNKENEIFGKPYGIPMGGKTSSTVLFYNKKILEEIGEAPPQTWDDVRRIAEKATKDTDGDGKIDQYGLSQGWGQGFYQDLNWNWYSFLWQNKGEMFDDEGKCTLDTPEAIGAANFLYDLKYKHKALPDNAMSLTNSEAFANYFVQGKAALAFSMSSESTFLTLDSSSDSFEYGYTMQLKGDNEGQGNFSPADQLVMMSAAKNKDLAWKFIKYMTAEKGAEEAHAQFKQAPTTVNEPYNGLTQVKEEMEKHGETSARPLKAARRAPEVYDYLWKTLQEMMNDQVKPKEAMEKVTKFANNLEY